MSLDDYLQDKLKISKKKASNIVDVINNYKKENKRKINIKIPTYSLGEEIFNSISHGLGAILSIVSLILMILKASTVLSKVLVSILGSVMIILYTISCIYHAISKNIEGKKILRVIDHSNVYLLVFSTYMVVSLLGISGILGYLLFAFVGVITILGIVFTCVNIDKNQTKEVICHLISGWSALIAIPSLLNSIGTYGLLFLIMGGLMYSIGSIIYKIGSHKKYMHSIFHIFCLLGTLCHFLCIYIYLL